MDKEKRPRRGRGGVTVRQVADHAGVGMMTVSRALRSPTGVSERLRSRIDAAVRELGYVPNRFANGLASEQTRLVTVIVPSLSSQVFIDIVRGADDVLRPEGYQVLFSSTYTSLEEEEALCRDILGWRPDGVILSGVDHTDAMRDLLADVPVVEALELGERPIDINIGLSHFQAGYDMGGYLLAKGYRRLAFIGAKLDMDFRAVRRMKGLQQAVRDQGVGRDVVIEAENNGPDVAFYKAGAAAIRRLLERDRGLDAVFCANDELAVGALFGCQRLGVKAPDDIAIAGFNGLDISAETAPSLTTILSPRYDMGRLAAKAILDRIQGDAEPGLQIDTGFKILERESA